jgi:uncharacterized membrane protein YdcZ (DUF606 family)
MSDSKSKLTKGIALMLSVAAGLVGVIVFSILLVFGVPQDKEAAAALGERPYWHFLAAAGGVFAVTCGGVLATLLSYLKHRKPKDEETAEITSPAHQPEQPSEKPTT